MFKVDRKSAEATPFEKPGTYNVTVASVTFELTPKGDASAKLIMRDEAGHVASEIITNKDTQYWKLNQLLAACPTVKIDDGTDIDIAKKDIFDAFMSKFKDAKLAIRLEEETYVKDGETKKTLRVKRFVKATAAEEVPF